MSEIEIVDGKAMDKLSEEQVQATETVIKAFEKSVFIQKIDYNEGIVYIGQTYNMGKPDEFKETLLTVNVACDSCGAAMLDIIRRVHDRCC